VSVGEIRAALITSPSGGHTARAVKIRLKGKEVSDLEKDISVTTANLITDLLKCFKAQIIFEKTDIKCSRNGKQEEKKKRHHFT